METNKKEIVWDVESLAIRMDYSLNALAFIAQSLEEEGLTEGATGEIETFQAVCLARRMKYFTGCLWCISGELAEIQAALEKNAATK